MKIEIKNCNNIDQAAVTIEQNCLNIKYAPNGSGKSTVAKAIAAFVENDSEGLQQLKPFKYTQDASNHNPSVKGAEAIKAVKVFDEVYIDRFVFTSEGIMPNTVDIFVKSPQYDERMKRIDGLLRKMQSIFSTNPEIDELIQMYGSFDHEFGRASKGYAKSSPIAKGLAKGNKIENVPQGLEAFAPYIKSERRNEWIKWHATGRGLMSIQEHICPFCVQSVTPDDESRGRLVSEHYDAKAVEHLMSTVTLFTGLAGSGLSPESSSLVKEITKNANGISEEEASKLTKIRLQAGRFVEHLRRLKGLSFYGIDNDKDRVGQIAALLESLRITPGDYETLLSDKVKELIDEINTGVDQVMQSVDELQREVNDQQKLMLETINSNQREINDFMKHAGYPYRVSIDNLGGGNFTTRLHHVEMPTDPISDVKAHLSFGERNAFALAMFVYDAISSYTPETLIVLDDPISSFDGNKKFSLLNLMFLGDGKSLAHKTVVLLTHDFGPVIDITKILKKELSDAMKAWYFCAHKGVVSEKSISQGQIMEAVRMNKENMKKASNDVLIRIAYFRKWKELRGEKLDPASNASYHVASSVEHLRDAPAYSEEKPLPKEETNKGIEEIKTYIKDFDYDEAVKKGRDKAYLRDLYNKVSSRFEKILIFRYMHANGWFKPLPNIIRKFMNEAFHVENDYLCQLNPECYEVIPDSQIQLFDEIVKSQLG